MISTKILDVNIRPGASIVGKIPTWIVGVLINDDRIGIPEPAYCESDVNGRDAPIPVIEPEPIGATPGEMPFVSGTEPAVETAVLPRMRQVKPRVGTAMADPMPVPGIDVGSIGMSRLIAEILVLLFVPTFGAARRRRCMVFLGTVRRNVAVSDVGVAAPVIRLIVVVLHEGIAGQCNED